MLDPRIGSEEPSTLQVLISQGQKVEVIVADSDGVFTIFYNADKGRLSVTADMPDATGREGVIYLELFNKIEGGGK
jgi:hypothetical protein